MAVDAGRAKSLFLAASDLSDPAERAAYLDRECGDDAELRGRVEALLRANDASPLPPPATEDATIDSEPGRPARGGTDLPTSEPDLDPPPVSITADYHTAAEPNVLIAGRYTLQQKIGEGGMGEVWVAKQSEPVKRKVALKLIKPGMDSRAVLQRFEQERQALAMMDHPNIAKVLDAGLAGQAGAEVSAAEATSEADAAMTLLKKAVSMGYCSADSFRTEDALDPLRKRDDFKRLIEEFNSLTVHWGCQIATCGRRR